METICFNLRNRALVSGAIINSISQRAHATAIAVPRVSVPAQDVSVSQKKVKSSSPKPDVQTNIPVSKTIRVPAIGAPHSPNHEKRANRGSQSVPKSANLNNDTGRAQQPKQIQKATFEQQGASLGN